MDSGNLAERAGAADLIEARLEVDGFYSPTSRGSPWDWTHMGMYAYFGLAKCCNRSLTDKLPCCCCGNPKEYRCTQCDQAKHRLEGRPHPLVRTYPPPWKALQMCNGALMGFKAGVTVSDAARRHCRPRRISYRAAHGQYNAWRVACGVWRGVWRGLLAA